MSTTYTRRYVYTDTDVYYKKDVTYPFYAFQMVSGAGLDTTHKVSKLKSMTFSTKVFVGTHYSRTKVKWNLTLRSAYGDTALTHEASGYTSPGSWGSVEIVLTPPEAQTVLAAAHFNTLQSITSEANASGILPKKNPIFLEITFESEEYLPSIDDFRIERCDRSGNPDANGTYVRYQFTTSVAKQGSALDGETYSILLTDGTNTLYSKSGFASVNPAIGTVTGDTTQSGVIYAKGERATFALTLTYHSEKAEAQRYIYPIIANFSIAKNNLGVAVGMFATGDSSFKVGDAYYSAFYGGIKGVNLLTADGSEEKTGGKLGAKDVYRRVFTATTANGYSADIPDVDTVISISGTAKVLGGAGFVPIGYNYSGNYALGAVEQKTGHTYRVHFTASASAVFLVVVDYTKV